MEVPEGDAASDTHGESRDTRGTSSGTHGLSRGNCCTGGNLLRLRLYYFFYHAAAGSVLLFLPVYHQSLGLRASESGIISMAAAGCGFFARPLFGWLSDIWCGYKPLMIACCLAFGFAFLAPWFVPPRQPEYGGSCSAADANETCWPVPSPPPKTWACHIIQETNGPGTTMETLSSTLGHGEEGQSSNGNDNISEAVMLHAIATFHSGGGITLRIKDESVETCKTHHPVCESDIRLACSYRSEADTLSTADDVKSRNGNNSKEVLFTIQTDINIKLESGLNGSTCQAKPVTAVAQGWESGYTSMYETGSPEPENGSATCHQCRYNCTLHQHDPAASVTADLVFILSLLITAVARAAHSASHTLSETLVFRMLGHEYRSYSLHRVWGFVGMIPFVLVFTFIDDQTGGHNFSAFFATCLALTIMATISVLCIKPHTDSKAAAAGSESQRDGTSADDDPENQGNGNTDAVNDSGNHEDTATVTTDSENHGTTRDVTRKQAFCSLLCMPFVYVFLVKLLVLGYYCGAGASFFFWFLTEQGSSQVTLGVCLIMHSVSSIAVSPLAKPIYERIGETKALYVVLVAYGLRFLCMSFVTNPWVAVPIELLHGITYSLAGPAISATVQKHLPIPDNIKATSQAIADAIYSDAGRMVGSFVTGELYDVTGPRCLFRIYAAVAVGMIAVWILLDWLFPLHVEQETSSSELRRPESESLVTDMNKAEESEAAPPTAELE